MHFIQFNLITLVCDCVHGVWLCHMGLSMYVCACSRIPERVRFFYSPSLVLRLVSHENIPHSLPHISGN